MTAEGQSWLVWMLMEAAATVYLTFILIYMSLTFKDCSQPSATNNTASKQVLEYGDHGLDIGMTAFVCAAALLCFIFAILFTINHFNLLVGCDRLILVGLVVSVVYLAAGLTVFIPLIIMQFRTLDPRLTQLVARECFHEWHIGVIVLAALSLVALIATIILFILRQTEKLQVTWLVSSQGGEDDTEKQDSRSNRRPSTAGLSKVHTETLETAQTPRPPATYQHSMLKSTGMDVQKVDTPRRLPPLRGSRVSPEPLEHLPLAEASPKKKKKKKKKKHEGEEVEYSVEGMEADTERKSKKKKRRKEEAMDLNQQETYQF